MRIHIVTIIAIGEILLSPLAGVASSLELTPEQQLGRRLYGDRNLSLNRNQACETCHSLKPVPGGLPVVGFVDPDNVRNGTPVSDGSFPTRFGKLNSPSAGYAAFSPFFHFDSEEGLFVGGQFWNGRSPTLAKQAENPFLNPVEMAMPSRWAVVSRLLEDPAYVKAFRELYGLRLLSISPWHPRVSDRLPTPPGVDEVYERMARAIGEFEKSRLFNKFNSKFDYVLAGMTSLSPLEAEGQALFDGKARCNLCHVSEPGIAPDGSVLPPLFTDFTYDNLGVGQNVLIPGNPQPDPGLAGNPTVAGLGKAVADGELGKHKVMSLRNIAVTAPYAHNGIFRDLQSITRFYNRRDWALEGRNGMYTCADNTDPNFGSLCFPEPEFGQTMNTDELGDLGLTESEEQALIAFMKTLTDDYPQWGQDPAVPPGTPPPFAGTPLPPSP